MLDSQRTSVPDTPEGLHREYLASLAAILGAVDLETAAAETALDRDALEALGRGDDPGITLAEAASVEALEPDAADAEAIEAAACDQLLLGMTTAVVDVETLAGELELPLGPTEIQQKIERRAPLSLAEYAAIEHAIVSRTPG